LRGTKKEQAHALGEIFFQANELVSYFLDMMTAPAGASPSTTKVLSIASLIGIFVAMYYEGLYQRSRPSQLCPALPSAIVLPGLAPFPSGHSAQTHLLQP
jgi:hypothetical protein